VVTLNIGGKPQLALTKTVVAHPIRPYIEHIDLLVIRRGEKVVVEVGVTVTGDAAPGSLVTQELSTLEVEADVSSIPEHIEVSVEGLAIGTQVLAGDVPLPEGTVLRTDAESLVANVVAAPTEEDMEAELDTEGAGVVEDAPESAEEPATDAEDSDS
jgi:large subunit ribosomal protein L25